MSETTASAPKRKSPIMSRKFWVWLTATAFMVLGFILDKNDINALIPWWGGISLAYAGIEGGCDIVSSLKGAAK